MARTSKSRGKTNFKLNNSPYPILKGLRKGLKNIFKASPIGMAASAIKGTGGDENTLGGKLDSINEKLDQLTSGGNEETVTENTIENEEGADLLKKIV